MNSVSGLIFSLEFWMNIGRLKYWLWQKW